MGAGQEASMNGTTFGGRPAPLCSAGGGEWYDTSGGGGDVRPGGAHDQTVPQPLAREWAVCPRQVRRSQKASAGGTCRTGTPAGDGHTRPDAGGAVSALGRAGDQGQHLGAGPLSARDGPHL